MQSIYGDPTNQSEAMPDTVATFVNRAPVSNQVGGNQIVHGSIYNAPVTILQPTAESFRDASANSEFPMRCSVHSKLGLTRFVHTAVEGPGIYDDGTYMPIAQTWAAATDQHCRYPPAARVSSDARQTSQY